MREQGYTGLVPIDYIPMTSAVRTAIRTHRPALLRSICAFFGLFWPDCDGTRISQLGQQADLFRNGTSFLPRGPVRAIADTCGISSIARQSTGLTLLHFLLNL
jgi:hypothetical protein